MSTVLQDIKYGTRMLAKSPGVTAAAALSLALGIGANTTMFSWIKSTLLMPLPGVRNQTEIVEIIDHSPAGSPNSISYPDFRDIRAQRRLRGRVCAQQPVGEPEHRRRGTRG